MDSKPKVFVSSTIVDFADLRSAIRHWLRELGFQPVMSEYNDFTRRPDSGSFDSCFEAIAGCQYYLLFVGDRKGSEYQKGISVTNQEYRVASQLARDGVLYPAIFVRNRTLNVIRDRHALLQSGMDFRPSTMMPHGDLQDAFYTESFIQEIRNTEFGNRGNDPSGFMWTYGFDGFDDIADALTVIMRIDGTINRKIILHNARTEISENMSRLMHKHDSGLRFGHHYLSPLRKGRPMKSEGWESPFFLSPEENDLVSMFTLFGLIGPHRMRSHSLQRLVDTGSLLQHDARQGILAESQAHAAALRLLNEMEMYAFIYPEHQKNHMDLMIKLQEARERRRRVDATQILMVPLYALHDRMENIYRLMFYLHEVLYSGNLSKAIPELNHSSPFENNQEDIDKERLTPTEIDEALVQTYIARGIGS